jgi:hypothetical protein
VDNTRLQNQDDEEGRLFRLISWQGRYKFTFDEAWKKRLDVTHGKNHQGFYAATVEGELLNADGDPHSVDRTLEMLKKALEKWQTRKTQRREQTIEALKERDTDFLWEYPEDGLVLQVGIRDLPRQVDRRPNNWRRDAHNLDYVWIKREEMLAIVPENVKQGEMVPFPPALTLRLVRFHLLDYVYGETPPWPVAVAKQAQLQLEVTRVSAQTVELTLTGQAPLCETNVEGTKTERGFDSRLYGELVFDRREQRFTRFDVVAVGTRWGSTGHSGRRQDDDPAPMGIAFTLAGKEPRHRTPPHISQSRNGLREYFGK